MIYVAVASWIMLAFLAGALVFALSLYRFLLARSLAGRPVLLTIPGNRPGHQATYLLTPSGWRGLPVKNGRRVWRWLRMLTDAELEAAQRVAQGKPVGRKGGASR